MKAIVAVGLALILAGCASASADEFDLLSGGRAKGADLQARIVRATGSPLGSQENPVRVNMPEGERAYLARLRCGDGTAPAFQRAGNFGPGVFGSIIDGYEVACAAGEPKPGMIFMDMYHPGHDETAAPPGFTLAPAGS